MKKIVYTLLGALLIGAATFADLNAQSVPAGMNYQAVARDRSGNVLANEAVDLKITLTNQQGSTAVTHYAEVHSVKTNIMGLFSVVIGSGNPTTGQFKSVPWSTDEIWMEIAIRSASETSFTVISSSKLLAVPYAFHAGTAGKLTGSTNAREAATTADGGWSLTGNAGTNSNTNRLGTTDGSDLVLATNNTERMRILSGGNITINNSLRTAANLLVDGTASFNSRVMARNGLTVDGNSLLALDAEIDRLKVNELYSRNTGRIEIKSDVQTQGLSVGQNFDVRGTAYLNGDMISRRNATFNGATLLNGDMISNGNATFNGNVTIPNLTVSANADGYLASFQNTSTGDGDGLKIKLGKTHPGWDGSAYLNAVAPGTQVLDLQMATVKGWIYEGKQAKIEDIISLFPQSMYVGSMLQLTSKIYEKINDALGLPKGFPALTIPQTNITGRTEIFPGLDFGIGKIPKIYMPAITLPQTTIVPANQNLFPALPTKLDNSLFPAFELPRISKTSVTNSLTKNNEFIAFTDKDDRKLGAIRAQSVNDFANDYLDGLYMTNLLSSLIGLDILKDGLSVFSEFANLADAYNSLGVEYTSGHGDYAEWLERFDTDEVIGAGDIVGVRGGKITKDLRDAEQIMAVSYRPIVLGNMPPAAKDHLGNKVAFMGQIPVKIQGPVSTGDYIVAKGAIPGYGVAISPAQMTIEDYKLAVGRSWEANAKPGPKMVNTLIGVHNGDFLKILKKNQQQVEQVEARLNTLETKTEALLKTLAPTIK